jgi:hypothetical protein
VHVHAPPRAQRGEVLPGATYLIVRYVDLLDHLGNVLLCGGSAGLLQGNVLSHCAS